MTTKIDLESMSIDEKMELMESIWNDLSADEHANLSPDWHKKTLEERKIDLNSGKAIVQTLDAVKQEIGKIQE